MYGWHSVPMELTISREEAAEYYTAMPMGGAIAYEQKVFTFEDGSKNPNDRVIMRGAAKVLHARYAWNYSNTMGGYVEAVLYRCIRRKYDNDFSQFTNIYGMDIDDIVHKLNEKYYMHGRTWRSVKNNLNSKIFRRY